MILINLSYFLFRLSSSAFKQDGEFPFSGYKETNHGVSADLEVKYEP